MGVHKINLPTAYMIETLRTNGVSDEEIVAQAEKKETGAWETIETPLDFNNLITFANQDLHAFRSILEDGYKVKFVTLPGLQRLLHLKFGKEVDQDFELLENGIAKLLLGEEQLAVLKQTLSDNWVIDEIPADHGINVNIQLR